MNLPQTAPEFQCLLPLWPPIARMTGLCHLAWLFYFFKRRGLAMLPASLELLD